MPREAQIIQLAAARPQERGVTPLGSAPANTRRSVIHDIEARYRDDRPDFRETRHVVIRPTRADRIADWLGDMFGESPRGFAFFAGLLFPLCAAAFACGYFGLRELLAGVGL